MRRDKVGQAPPRQGLRNQAQRVEVDLGVEGGGGQVLMTKDRADREQASALPQQLARQRVPEPVRTQDRHGDASAGSLDDVTDQVSPDRSARGPQRQEQMAGSFRGPAVGQVSDQGFTDSVRQRQPVLPTALAADDQLTGAPVHITELQAGHLDRAQAQPREQHHDCEVPASDSAAAVAAVQQPLDLGGRQRWWRQGGPPPATTGGTAAPSRNGVTPCKYRNLSTERSSATRPLADPTETRPHSRSRNALTAGVDRVRRSGYHAQLVARRPSALAAATNSHSPHTKPSASSWPTPGGSRVAPTHCCVGAPSEPCLRLSPHTAQASPWRARAADPFSGPLPASL